MPGLLHSIFNDEKRKLFLEDRDHSRTVSQQDHHSDRTPHRKKIIYRQKRYSTNFLSQSFETFPKRRELDEIREKTKAIIGVFVQTLEKLPIRAVPSRPKSDGPTAGLDMDFSTIEADVRTRVTRHGRRSREATKLFPGNFFPYHPPSADKILIPKRWTREVEDYCRFQAAGYQDETYFRMLHGQNVKIPRWKTTGFIKALPHKLSVHTLHFPSTRVCRLAQLGRVRIYRYSWKFLENDFRRIALFQMRFAAVQKAAIAHAEMERARLIKHMELERENAERHAHHHDHHHEHHHNRVSPVVTTEEDDLDADTVKRKHAHGKHHHHQN